MRIGGVPPQRMPGSGQDLAARSSDRDNAFGFDELGVFGVKKQAGAALAGRAPTPPCMEPVPAREDDAPQHVNAGPADAGALAPTLPPARRPACNLGGAPGAIDDRPMSGPKADVFGPSCELPGPLAESGAESAEPAERNPVAPVRAREADNPFALTLATSDAAVSIVAKAPPLDAEGRALLRRLLRQILSERGLSLADFQLNGVPLGADFLSMTGGSHGPRAR